LESYTGTQADLPLALSAVVAACLMLERGRAFSHAAVSLAARVGTLLVGG